MTQISAKTKYELEAVAVLTSGAVAGLAQELRNINLKGVDVDGLLAGYRKSALTFLGAKGALFGLAAGTAASGDFTKAATLTGANLLIDAGVSIGINLLFSATFPLSASVGIAIGTAALVTIYSDEIYDVVDEYVFDEISELGTAIGQSIGDIVNHDWEAEFANGQAAFESAFQQKANEFKQSLTQAITDLQNAGNEFAQAIDETLTGFDTWLTDAKASIFGEAQDAVNNVDDATFTLTRPDMGNITRDPLVVDLNGDGIHLTAAENGTAFFDIDADGIREQVGWISAGDGLIVRDLNNNGTIDDIGELIGTETEDAYTVLDGFDLNNDNKINNQDAVWNSLKVWQDSNGNGVTDAGELQTLAHHNITEFSINDSAVGDIEEGNLIFSESSYIKDGDTELTQAVFFNTQQQHTAFDYPDGWTADDAVLELPTLSGGGEVVPLDYAMQSDMTLRSMVQSLVDGSQNMTYDAFYTAVENIVMRWSGAENAVDGSRGPYIDAKTLAVLEAFSGNDFPWADMRSGQAPMLMSQYNDLMNGLVVRLGSQVFGSYVLRNFDGSNISDVEGHNFRHLAFMVNNPENGQLYVDFEGMMRSLISDKKADGFTTIDTEITIVKNVFDVLIPEQAELKTKLFDIVGNIPDMTDDVVTFNDAHIIAQRLVYGDNITLNGDNTDNSITAASTLDGAVLDGKDGADTLTGNNHDNIIIGGRDNDEMIGYDGNDMFIYHKGDGDDEFTEYSGNGDNDALRLKGLLSSDVTHIERYTTKDANYLKLHINDGSILDIGEIYGHTEAGLEQIIFDDATWTQAILRDTLFAQEKTDGDDTIIGFDRTDDALSGGLGNDTLYGYDGNDSYSYNIGDGNDEFVEYSGDGDNDTLRLNGLSSTDVTHLERYTSYDANYLKLHMNDGSVLDIGEIYGHAEAGLEQIIFDDTTWTQAILRDTLFAQEKTDNDDIIKGFRNTADTLEGGLGNDTLYGFEQDDSFIYNKGDGNDTIIEYSGDGDDTLTLNGVSSADVTHLERYTSYDANYLKLHINDGSILDIGEIYGHAEAGLEQIIFDDTTWTQAILRDTLFAQEKTDNDDIIKGFRNTADTLEGGLGNDTLYGFEKDDSFIYNKGDGNDTIIEYSRDGNDALILNDIYFTNTNVELYGSALDHATLRFDDGGSVDVGQIYNGSSAEGIETYQFMDITLDHEVLYNLTVQKTGLTGDDNVIGTNDADIILGWEGNDTLDGGLGDDWLSGGTGTDTVSGSEGDDVIIGHADGDTLDGGAGEDIIDYSTETMRFHFDLNTTRRASGQWVSTGDPAVDYDFISGFEHVKLGSGNDYIEGSGTLGNEINNHLWGNAGADKMFGFYGDDKLYGGSGNDELYGGFNNDLIEGGGDNDKLYGGAGNDDLYGQEGDDKIWGDTDNDMIFGGTGDDEAYGGAGHDTIYGHDGDDSLAGYNGDDVLYGGIGNDDLYGQAGADTYYGGFGKDYMYSGGSDGAKDTFIFTDAAESVIGSGDERDRIVGFEVGTDQIDLAALGVASASATTSGLGADVYLVNIAGNTDFEIVVTTTGGTLSSADIIV